MAQFEVEKREHEIKMRKMEQEMEEVFEMKVQEKLQKLKDIEADVSVQDDPQTFFGNPERSEASRGICTASVAGSVLHTSVQVLLCTGG